MLWTNRWIQTRVTMITWSSLKIMSSIIVSAARTSNVHAPTLPRTMSSCKMLQLVSVIVRECIVSLLISIRMVLVESHHIILHHLTIASNLSCLHMSILLRRPPLPNKKNPNPIINHNHRQSSNQTRPPIIISWSVAIRTFALSKDYQTCRTCWSALSEKS